MNKNKSGSKHRTGSVGADAEEIRAPSESCALGKNLNQVEVWTIEETICQNIKYLVGLNSLAVLEFFIWLCEHL